MVHRDKRRRVGHPDVVPSLLPDARSIRARAAAAWALSPVNAYADSLGDGAAGVRLKLHEDLAAPFGLGPLPECGQLGTADQQAGVLPLRRRDEALDGIHRQHKRRQTALRQAPVQYAFPTALAPAGLGGETQRHAPSPTRSCHLSLRKRTRTTSVSPPGTRCTVHDVAVMRRDALESRVGRQHAEPTSRHTGPDRE